MDKNTGTQGATRPHIDTLTVVYGYAFVITAVETIRLGSGPTSPIDEPSPWLYLPAGRGE